MEEKKLHIVMMPWLAMGHLIPFMELSKRIAQQGHKISYISTPKNFSRLPKIPPNLSDLIHPIKVYLPSIENLPQNGEATIDLPENLKTYLRKAYDGLEPQVSKFLLAEKPDWIIMDYAPHWITKLSRQYGIPCAFLNLFNSAVMTFYGAPSALRGLGTRSGLEDYTKKPDWVPFNTSIFYRDYEARELFAGAHSEESGVSEAERLARAIEHCQVVAVRSSPHLEAKWLDLLGGLYEKTILPIGFLPPLPDSSLSISWNDHMKEWLDGQKQGEVVYVAFGSEAKLDSSQISELAAGLEKSQLPFIWALRDWNMLPQDFEERIKDQGKICKEWVPQVSILSHSSIGGFLTHGGWNSIIEGLALGVKLILLPLMYDQGLNARYMVETGLGVEVQRNELNGSFTGHDITKSLSLVMKEEEGEQIGSKVKQYKKTFGDEEMNESSLKQFLTHLVLHKSKL